MNKEERNEAIIEDIITNRLPSKDVADKYGLSRYHVLQIVRMRHPDYRTLLGKKMSSQSDVDRSLIIAVYETYYKEKLHLTPYDICKLVACKYKLKTDTVADILHKHYSENAVTDGDSSATDYNGC